MNWIFGAILSLISIQIFFHGIVVERYSTLAWILVISTLAGALALFKEQG